MKTLSLRKEDAQHDWYVVDASDKILGRLATKIADRIRAGAPPQILSGQISRAATWIIFL